MKNLLLLLLLLFPGILACGTEDVDEIDPPDMRECNRETVEDWEAVNTLEWTDSLPDQSRFKDFEALLEAMTGDHDVARDTVHGTLEISRGEGAPSQKFSGTNCLKLFYMPVDLKLMQGDKTWTKPITLLVAQEHLGYVTDREVPKPGLWIPAAGGGSVDDVDAFPSFGAQDSFPSVKHNEESPNVVVTLKVVPRENILLEVKVDALVTGGEGATMYASKPWFTIEGDLKD